MLTPAPVRGSARSGSERIAYRVLGDGARTWVLVMGLGGRAADWGEAFPHALAREGRVVLLDNRGTGASSQPDTPWSLEDMASDVLAVLDDLDLGRASVLGLSMGGMIAQELALAHPERVERVVLMSTHAGGPQPERPPEIVALFLPPRGTSMETITRDALRLITGPGFADAHAPIVEELVRRALAQPTPKRTFLAQVQAILSSDRRERLGALGPPALVIHGTDDPLIPVEAGRELARLIPGARLVELPGCGHLPHLERAEAVLEALRAPPAAG
ncbi:MAG: alpha/beta fold hydrolase [Polyangiaceae bacterium]|nr:alpha/beta fold hydrolase [Polyangiaceae bacterium]